MHRTGFGCMLLMKLNKIGPSLGCRRIFISSVQKGETTHFGYETVQKSDKSKKGIV
jgi:hypothetical protein